MYEYIYSKYFAKSSKKTIISSVFFTLIPWLSILHFPSKLIWIGLQFGSRKMKKKTFGIKKKLYCESLQYKFTLVWATMIYSHAIYCFFIARFIIFFQSFILSLFIFFFLRFFTSMLFFDFISTENTV
jgi:hypothetical protein